MGLLGGILGGMIGAAFAGPWGAAIGAVIGYNVNGSAPKTGADTSQRQVVLCSIFRALAKIAKADGVVSQEEAALVSEILREFGGDDAALRARLKAEFDQAKNSGVTFHDEVAMLAPLLPASAKLSVMEMFCTLARVDGRISQEERLLLREAENLLGCHGFVDRFFNASEQNTRREEKSSALSLAESYRILGIEPAATDAEVKKAWHKKTLEFHPDRVMGKGLSESFIEFAGEQMKKVNLAYETIKNARNL